MITDGAAVEAEATPSINIPMIINDFLKLFRPRFHVFKWNSQVNGEENLFTFPVLADLEFVRF